MDETIESTSDERTVNNSTRQQYRVLSDAEKKTIDWFKEAGAAFIVHAENLRTERPEAGREFALAITHMEDAVMRAVRGVTQ
jgi:hypothetical protein